MDYTREPILETVVTPKEGCRLVLRNTKGASQEEYFVDAVEIVSFGISHFFRSLEKSKPFLIPVSDFEVIEVKEPRMVLKTVGVDRSIKIGNGKDKDPRPQKEKEPPQEKEKEKEKEEEEKKQVPSQDVEAANLQERKRNRRSSRRRRDRVDPSVEEVDESSPNGAISPEIPAPRLIAPPETLISETLARYRESEEFRGAFYEKEGEELVEEVSSIPFSITTDFDEADHLLFQSPVELRNGDEELAEEQSEPHLDREELF